MEEELRQIVLAAIETGVNIEKVMTGIFEQYHGSESAAAAAAVTAFQYPREQDHGVVGEGGGKNSQALANGNGQIPLPSFPALHHNDTDGADGGTGRRRSSLVRLSVGVGGGGDRGGGGGVGGGVGGGGVNASALRASLSALALGSINPTGAFFRPGSQSDAKGGEFVGGGGGGGSRRVSEVKLPYGSRRNSAASKIIPFLPLPLPLPATVNEGMEDPSLHGKIKGREAAMQNEGNRVR